MIFKMAAPYNRELTDDSVQGLNKCGQSEGDATSPSSMRTAEEAENCGDLKGGDFCQSSHKVCRRTKLKGFDFCHKHILEDKNSPFQRCFFISKSSGKQCTNPAPKIRDKKTFCLVHTRNPKLKKAHAEQLKRKRKLAGQQQQNMDDPEQKYVLRSNLNSPEARNSKHRKIYSGDNGSGDERKDTKDVRSARTNALSSTTVHATWFGEQQSDAESVDSEDEDPLRYAGVWTFEEGLKIYCNKLKRLRSLYKDQYSRLTHVLKERRRKYLSTKTSEDMKISKGDIPLMLSEEDQLLRRYQKLSGVELLLLRQVKEKRTRAHQKTMYLLKCHYSIQGQRCQNKVLPMAKYCLSHICEDPNQFLYKTCIFEDGSSALLCKSPVFNIKGAPLCDIHSSLRPPIPNEALQRIQDEIKHRTSQQAENDIDQEQPVKVENMDTKSLNTDSLNTIGIRTSSPGNIFSILESEEPKVALRPTATEKTSIQCAKEHSTIVPSTKEHSTSVQSTTEHSTGVQSRKEYSTGVQGTKEHSTGVENTKKQSTSVESKKEHSTGVQSTKEHSTGVENTKKQSTSVESKKEHSTGVQSTKEHSTGVQSTTEHSTGVESTKEHSTGVQSTTDYSTGVQSTKEHSTGVQSTRGHSTGVQNTKEQSTGIESKKEHSTGVESATEHSTGVENTKKQSTGVESKKEHSTGVQSTKKHSTGVQSRKEHSTGVQNTRDHSTGVESRKEQSTGVESTKEPSTGVQSKKKHSTGVESTKEYFTGVQSTTEHSTGVLSTKQPSTGVQNTKVHSTGVQNTKEHSSGVRSMKEHFSGVQSTKQLSMGPQSTEEHSAGVQNSRENFTGVQSAKEHSTGVEKPTNADPSVDKIPTEVTAMVAEECNKRE